MKPSKSPIFSEHTKDGNFDLGGKILKFFMAKGRLVVRKHKPDLKEKIFFFISGIILSVPFTLFFERFSTSLCVVLPVFYANLCSVAIFASFIEEFAKAYPLLYRHGETERSVFVLGFLVGLGFGIAEFYLYVFQYGAPLLGRITGIFFHAAATSIVCYGIAKGKAIRFYLLATGLHFMNNFSLFLDTPWRSVSIAAPILTYLLSWHFYNKTTGEMIEPPNVSEEEKGEPKS